MDDLAVLPMGSSYSTHGAPSVGRGTPDEDDHQMATLLPRVRGASVRWSEQYSFPL